MTERYFQILETHKLYAMLKPKNALKIFAEHHVLCAWSYNYLLRSLHMDMVKEFRPLGTQMQKEAMRIISEICLEEELEAQQDGSYVSNFELYLEAMQDLGADMTASFSFFDLCEAGQPWKIALHESGFPEAASHYARQILSFSTKSLHERAAVLFYEGEPYLPDALLKQLAQQQSAHRYLGYFERHIEGLKQPGFSASGRLVELLCSDDADLNEEAEKAAETSLSARAELWNSLAKKLEDEAGSLIPIRPSLRLVTVASF